MSSILKALKKLEAEYPGRQDEIPWPQRLGPVRIIRRWEIHSGRFTMILWGSLGLILLVASGWFILYARQPISGDTVSSAAIPESVPLKTVQLPEFLRSPSQTEAASNDNPHQVRAAGGPSDKKRRQADKSVSTLDRAGATRKDRGAVKQTPQHRPVQTATALQADLTLQAISWSQQAAKRIAVINGQIVREGQTFEDFAVIRIEPDGVLLRKGGADLSLAFNLQGTKP